MMTKYFSDLKLRKAQAQQDVMTFFADGIEKEDPIALNKRAQGIDRTWKDGMFAASEGHPGAYYTTVMGGEAGNQVSAQVIIAPPNEDRKSKESLKLSLFMLTSNADDMFDYDDTPLDFFLPTTELSGYNDRLNYAYSGEFDEGEYETYKENTIGYWDTMIEQKSNGTLNGLRINIRYGEPLYEFIDNFK